MHLKNQFLFISTLLLIATACKDKHTESAEVAAVENKQTNMKEKSTESGKETILCFGNSLTAGYGLEESSAWPALLQNRLDSLGYDYTVINAGLSGETSSGGLNRLDWILRDEPSIFILELGANDMLRGLNVESSFNNLDRILEKLRNTYPKTEIVIAGMMSPPNMGKTYEEKFNAIYPELASKYNAALIPFFLEGVAGIDSLNLPDGKHPNEDGQQLVLENVWSYLKPILRKD